MDRAYRFALMWAFTLALLAGATRAPAVERIVGNEAVGTNVYPAGVSGMRRVAAMETNDFNWHLYTPILVDPIHGFAYYNSEYYIIKVSLPEFRIVNQYGLSVSGRINGGAIDPAGLFAYFIIGSSPSRKVVKVRLSDFTEMGTLTLSSTNIDSYVACSIDPLGNYAYFVDPSQIFNVRLSDFTNQATLSLTSTGTAGNVWIDHAGAYAYFAQTSRLVKVRLADFQVAASLPCPLSDGFASFSFILDGAEEFGYVATGGAFSENPGKLLRIRLSDFIQVDDLALSNEFISTAVRDLSGDFAIFGITNNTNYHNQLVKMRLSDFTRIETLTISNWNEVGIRLEQGVLDPITNSAFFGTEALFFVKYALGGIHDTMHATKITLPESAALNRFCLYSHQAGGHVRVALYDDTPSRNLVWSSAETTNTKTNDWISIPIASGTPSGLSLRAGNYWMAFNSDSPNDFVSYLPGAPGDGLRATHRYQPSPASLASVPLQSVANRWSFYLAYTPTFIDTPPTAPTLTLTPSAPGTLDPVVATASGATDADPGDSIVGYRYEWLLSGVVKSTSSTLAASLTAKGQFWTCKAWAQDSYGQWSLPATATVTIVNTPPTQPIVDIRPQPARAGQALVVDVQTYSTDPDGDAVGYDFNWYKSTNGGATWIHKLELDGSSQVVGEYILDGELWEVRYIPYEKTGGAKPGAEKSGTRYAGRTEGQYGWDRAYIGVNNLPKLALAPPFAQRQAGGTLLGFGWSFSDADGDPCTIDLDWSSKTHPSLQTLARGVAARQGGFRAVTAAPLDPTLIVHGAIHDAKGAVTQQFSAPVTILPPVPAFIVNFILGKSADSTGLDSNRDGIITAADLVNSVNSAPPETPAAPLPVNGAKSVSATPTLDWADGPHARSYQLYLWPANTPRPATPVNLTSSVYSIKTALSKNTSYWWQVVAVGKAAQVSGPVWGFTVGP